MCQCLYSNILYCTASHYSLYVCVYTHTYTAYNFFVSLIYPFGHVLIYIFIIFLNMFKKLFFKLLVQTQFH